MEGCTNVQLSVKATVLTSVLELISCENSRVNLATYMYTITADKCTKDTHISYGSSDYFGYVYWCNVEQIQVDVTHEDEVFVLSTGVSHH